jgi:hypothetical protein
MSTPALLEMLGVCWDLNAPVVALAWDVGDVTVGFALGDGHLAAETGRWRGGVAGRGTGSAAGACRLSHGQLPEPGGRFEWWFPDRW